MPLFCLSAMVRKPTPKGDESAVLLGYRLATSEDEAKGMFLTFTMSEKPGFTVVDLLCLEILEDHLRASLSDQKALIP